MAIVIHLSEAARNAALNAIADLLDGGSIEFYDGTMPANTSAAASGTKLATLTFAASSFAAASGGAMSVASVAGDASADATGSPSYVRFKSSGGTVHLDGNAGTSDAFMLLPSATITSGSPVDIVSGTLSLPSGA